MKARKSTSREKLKLQAVGNSNNPEVPEEAREDAHVHVGQHFYLKSTWEKRRGMALSLGATNVESSHYA